VQILWENNNPAASGGVVDFGVVLWYACFLEAPPVKLYHGSSQTVDSPKIINPNRALDFVGGFYTTTNSGQARDFARRIVIQRKIQGEHSVGVINEYEFSVGELNVLEFKTPDESWFDFVLKNRTNEDSAAADSNFDIVIGPVAFDITIAYTSSLYPIIQELIANIASKYNLNEIAAAEQLYNSKLYAQLEVEGTKIWHLSIPALMSLFINEHTTGKLNLEEFL
jgi:hypothetical protein